MARILHRRKKCGHELLERKRSARVIGLKRVPRVLDTEKYSQQHEG
jgi:hypothetical protein